MASAMRVHQSLYRKLLPFINRRTISTSKKNRDTVSVTTEDSEKAVVHKNWISYGFDMKSKEADRNAFHSLMFASVTICLIFGGFYFTYVPDYNLRDWAQREAFLELKRREDAGLPLVDRDLIDASTIMLPSDEELGDEEIII